MQIRRASRRWTNTRPESSHVRNTAIGTRDAACVWPGPVEGRCGDPPVEGLALCPKHAGILHRGPGRTCAWPDCLQAAPFRSLCSYHTKRAVGLLGPYRE